MTNAAFNRIVRNPAAASDEDLLLVLEAAAAKLDAAGDNYEAVQARFLPAVREALARNLNF